MNEAERQTELKRVLADKNRTGDGYCSCGGCMFDIGEVLKCGDCGHIEKKEKNNV